MKTLNLNEKIIERIFLKKEIRVKIFNLILQGLKKFLI